MSSKPSRRPRRRSTRASRQRLTYTDLLRALLDVMSRMLLTPSMPASSVSVPTNQTNLRMPANRPWSCSNFFAALNEPSASASAGSMRWPFITARRTSCSTSAAGCERWAVRREPAHLVLLIEHGLESGKGHEHGGQQVVPVVAGLERVNDAHHLKVDALDRDVFADRIGLAEQRFLSPLDRAPPLFALRSCRAR